MEKNLAMELWRKIKNNGHTKRQRRSVVAKMLSPPSSTIVRSPPSPNQHHPILQTQNAIVLHPDNVSIIDSAAANDNSPIVEAENECEIATDWQSELNDDFVNSEIVRDRNLIFAQDLAHWSITHAIRRDALNELLSILNEATPELNLPRDARTILKTPVQKQVIAEDGFGGQYWHYGLEKALRVCLKNINYCPLVEININIDGLPLFDSSRVEFWPILFNIHEKYDIPPMVIGIYCGKGKHIVCLFIASLFCGANRLANIYDFLHR